MPTIYPSELSWGTFMLGWKSSFLVVLSFPLWAAASDTSPATIDDFYARLKAAGVVKKADVLAAFPAEMKKNYVLIRNSRSRQRGTSDLPRVLHFSKNAELIVSSSGHPGHGFGANDLELMDFDRRTGKWRLATITMNGLSLRPPIYNDRVCLACHGDNPRPIWGEYHNWPGAYGGDPANGTEEMALDERFAFQKFLDAAKSQDGYRHLEMLVAEKMFYLKDTTYSLPNTVFTARFGLRIAEALFAKISLSPSYGKLRLALLASNTRLCQANSAVDEFLETEYQKRLSVDAVFAKKWSGKAPSLEITKALRLLDLDPFADFRIDQFPRFFAPKIGEEDAMLWNAGGDELLSLVSFLVLRDAARNDATLGKLLSPSNEAMENIYSQAFSPTSEYLLTLDRPETKDAYLSSLFPYVEKNFFVPALGSPSRPSAVCDYFSKARE